MIIDCHTHCYPVALHADPRAWAEQQNEPHWADLVAPIGRKSIQDWATPERMLQDMRTAGVEKAILLGWYWENESTCRWHNEVIADWVRTAPEQFIGFASIDPNGQVIDQLEHAKSLGLRGVGELHPGLQRFNSQSKGWLQLADWCTAHDWPVNFHCTATSGKDHPSAIPTPLDDYLVMARDTPNLKIILAHWGGGLAKEMPSPLPPNIFFDCSASPLLYPANIFNEVVEKIGYHHLLFGSDYPLRLFPRAQKNAEMITYLDTIKNDSGLSQEALGAITYQNALRVLNL